METLTPAIFRGLKVLAARAALALAAISASGAAVPPPEAPPTEHEVKAVYLLNFARFVEWPAGTFARTDAPLVIGVLGTDPFGPAIDEAVRGEKVGNRPIVVQRFRRIDEVGTACHILFVGESEAPHFQEVLAALRGRRILSVSDIEDFALRGGMVRFITEAGRVRMRFNLDAIREGGLVVSSKLLNLRASEIIEGGQIQQGSGRAAPPAPR